MTTKSISEPLQRLVDKLAKLTQRATLAQLSGFLSDVDIRVDDLGCFAHFGDKTYRRNLICENEWYELLCICWKSGQRSPIHNHARSSCGLRIMQGVATETLFDLTPSDQIKAVSSTDYSAGHVCSSQDADIHQVSNLQSPSHDLMTLHIYSPPLKEMDIFSLFSAETEIYVPENSAITCHFGDCI